jgi:hypothetical protein
MTDGITRKPLVSPENMKVLKIIVKRQEEDHKMIDGWKKRWLAEEVRRAELLQHHLGSMRDALNKLGVIGIQLNAVEDAMFEIDLVAIEILRNANSKLDIHTSIPAE